MAGRLKGKRAFCTAAGQGIGKATALMFAAEVRDADTPASRLARELGYEWRVLNLGVRGYNTVQSARVGTQLLASETPVAAVVYTFAPNDLL